MEDARAAVETTFRRHAGQMVATLARIFGVARLDVVEDAVHEALVRALRRWPRQGAPANPSAWLIQTAKHAAIDRLRREGREGELPAALEDASQLREARFADELREDRLCMIFACCHPALTREAQVALTLQAAGGFSARTIAAAFLVSEPVMAQRLVRAKARLRELGVRLATPGPESLEPRIDAVLEVLYLLFNEGYSPVEGEQVVRAEVCREAAWLAGLVATHPATERPRAHALAGLLCFQGARLAQRADAAGELLLLSEQDRSQWDAAAIRQGLLHMERAAAGAERSDYHLEMEIAAQHALAPSFEQTDWTRLERLYGELLLRKPSPVVELNRVIALSHSQGCGPALEALGRMPGERLTDYYPFHATRGELLSRAGSKEDAARAFEAATGLCRCEPVRRFLERRRAESASLKATR